MITEAQIEVAAVAIARRQHPGRDPYAGECSLPGSRRLWQVFELDARAALEAAEAARWQPIETAPRRWTDGRFMVDRAGNAAIIRNGGWLPCSRCFLSRRLLVALRRHRQTTSRLLWDAPPWH